MDDGQAQAQTLLGVIGFPLVVLVKDVGHHLRGHPDPGVGDPDLDLLRGALERNGHLAPLGGEFDGVVQQIDPDVAHQLLIPHIGDGLQIGGEGDALFLPGAGEQDGAPLDLLVQGEGLLLGDGVLGLQTGHQQGAVGQIGQAVGLLGNDLEVLAAFLLGESGFLKQLGKAGDGGDGGLELVGEAVDKILPQGLDPLKLLGHLVEILIGGGQRAGTAGVQPQGEVPLRHAAQAPGQAGEKLVEAVVQAAAQDDRGADEEQQGPQAAGVGGREGRPGQKPGDRHVQGGTDQVGQDGQDDKLLGQPQQKADIGSLFPLHSSTSAL